MRTMSCIADCQERQNMTTSHALADIADQGMLPVSKQENPAHAHVHAHAILAAFSDQTVEEKRMAVVFRMAIGDSRLTSGQLEEELRAALKMASENDKNNGWKAPEGAKGAALYGPKRASMNTVSSTIRQVWGALSHCNLAATHTSDGQGRPNALKPSTSFAFAVKEARKALKEHQIDWRGAPLPTEDQKAAVGASKALADEMAAYAKEYPIRAGETIADFQKRQALAVEIRLIEGEKEREEAAVKEAAENLIKAHGLEMCTLIADLLYAQWEEHVKVQTQQAE